jgi:3'-phosphoadenosine 5'-phosphosulfate sulfotransferase (PAPS reductase)/FAD synthetase
MNPYRIEYPAIISFSGGRTSGYMLAKIIEAYEGKLPNGIKVVFCNTGLEHEKTYEFIKACEANWGIKITWIEYQGKQQDERFKVVSFETASRKGEPFGILIDERQYLPNPVARFCTVELKIRLLDRYVKTLGPDFKKCNQAIGLRYDEPRRVANVKSNSRRNPAIFPIFEAKNTLPEIFSFWNKQSFDLNLQMHHGNCQGCFLKSRYRLDLVAKEDPDALDWWIDQEAKIIGSATAKNHTFRKDRPSYESIVKQSKMQLPLFTDFDDTVSCFCTD